MKPPGDRNQPTPGNDHGEVKGDRSPVISRETLAGVRRREPVALGEFFELTFDRIYGLAFRLLGNRSQAEDLTQDVYLRVHRSADQIDVERDPMPWLRTITANLCRDHWRSFGAKVAARSIPVEDAASAGEIRANGRKTPEGEAIAMEHEQLVQEAINSLPEQLREVVVFRDYEGMSHDEIAEVIGASSVAVRKRYSRALTKLGKELEDRLQ